MGFWGTTGKVLLTVGKFAVEFAGSAIDSTLKDAKKSGAVSKERYDEYIERKAKVASSVERVKDRFKSDNPPANQDD